MATRSESETFDLDWRKAQGWAESQGIGPSAYLPVYQLDVQRLKSGEFTMSAAERNRSILAAHTPTQVTQGPTPRHPGSPTNILGNLMSTAKSIFTGLIRMPEEIWDSADKTIHAVMNPASLNASTTGGTIANWLQTTLLSFLPGASDVGAVMRYGLHGGIDYLAEHPITSLLDAMPASLQELIWKGTVKDGVMGAIAKMLPEKAGVTLEGVAKENLSLGDRIEAFGAKLGTGGAGVGKALANLGKTVNDVSAMGQNLYAYLVDPAARALSSLSPTEWDQLQKILDMRKTQGGDAVATAMRDPNLSVKVRDALVKTLEGPLRFSVEESIFSGHIKAAPGVAMDAAGTVTLSGDKHFYAVPKIKSIETARLARDVAERRYVEAMAPVGAQATEIEQLDAVLPQAIAAFTSKVLAARQAIGDDPALLEQITQEMGKAEGLRRFRGIEKMRQAEAVVGEGGLAAHMLEQLKTTHNPVQIRELAGAMRDRLSAWGAKAANAGDVPALAALRASLTAFDDWADRYERNAKAIDEAIHGTEDAQRHFKGTEDRRAEERRQLLKRRHAEERANAYDTYRQGRARARSDFAKTLSDISARRWRRIAEIEDRYERAAAAMTGAQVDRDVMPRARAEVAESNRLSADAARSTRHDFSLTEQVRKARHDTDMVRMGVRHKAETALLERTLKEDRAAHGEVIAELVGWREAVDGFHQAIFDHPATEYRDAMLVLYHKHLLAHEHSATLVAETERYISETAKDADREAALAQLRSDPAVLAELMTFHFNDVFSDPRVDPDVAEMAAAAAQESWNAGFAELQTLIAQKGMVIQYIPTSTSADLYLTRDAIRPLLARRGEPLVDMAKAKVWTFTPATHDFALGVNKAVVQAIQRDTTIELMEHYLRPMAMDDGELRTFLQHVRGPTLTPPGAGSAEIEQRFVDIAHRTMHLQEVRPNDLFHGVSFGTRGDSRLWLPRPIVAALGQLEDERMGFFRGKGLRLYRYSILGLSPRYDAHIVLGGTTMLAFRSSWRVLQPSLLKAAWEGLRDGTLPIVSHAATEEGFEESVFRQFYEAGGSRMVALEVQEHVERRQGVARAAAKPFHFVKALADLNFRFTRAVRDMQSAVAYLDAFSKATGADDKLSVENAETGRQVVVSTKRAMEAAQRHVEQVYGNLRAMSPFERQVVTAVLPFYGWQRHIMAYVLSFPVDHPWRALVLSQAASHASQSVPAAWPIRIQFLFFLGSPSDTGTVTPVTLRTLDPFRTVANYFSLSGLMQSLTPWATAPLSMIDPTIVYGENTMYPKLTYTAFYGMNVAAPAGNLVTAASQFVPQLSAASSALSAMTSVHSLWSTDRDAALKQLFDNLNIPVATPPVNLAQESAKGEAARYEAAKTAATTAFRTGTFRGIAGFRTVPTPLNPDYTITPKQLEAIYNAAIKENPTLPPAEWLMPKPTPFGF